MKPVAGWMAMAMLACTMSAQAQVYKWVGPDGKVQYGDTPPPSSATRSAPEAVAAPSSPGTAAGPALPYEVAEAARKNPVTLYTSSNCSPCDTGRTMLTSRGVPFREKTVSTNEDVERLREVSGDTQVPVLLIGKRKHLGYVASEWTEALTAAAYPTSSKLPASYRNPPPEAAAPPRAAPEPVQETSAPTPSPAPPTPASDASPGFRF